MGEKTHTNRSRQTLQTKPISSSSVRGIGDEQQLSQPAKPGPAISNTRTPSAKPASAAVSWSRAESFCCDCPDEPHAHPWKSDYGTGPSSFHSPLSFGDITSPWISQHWARSGEIATVSTIWHVGEPTAASDTAAAESTSTV